jgi:hypothetical protein
MAGRKIEYIEKKEESRILSIKNIFSPAIVHLSCLVYFRARGCRELRREECRVSCSVLKLAVASCSVLKLAASSCSYRELQRVEASCRELQREETGCRKLQRVEELPQAAA